MKCSVCGAPSAPVFSKEVLFAHHVQYFRCEACGYLQTEAPYWLNEAYSSAIAALDVGLVQRNLELASRIEDLILESFDPNGRFLDFAGGYGLLVRLMRDRGFDFYWTDRYCENLFAKCFSVDRSADDRSGFDLVTAVEVLEHLVDPCREIEKMLVFSRSLLVTTVLLPDEDIEDWWYLSPETGQHVGFFTLRALQVVADRFGLKLVSDGALLHLLTDRPIRRLPVSRLARPRWLRWLVQRRRSPRPASLLPSDFELARRMVRNERNR